MKQNLNPEEFLKIIALFLSETNDGFAILNMRDPSFPIVYVNKGFSVITGYSAEEVIGKNICFILNNNSEGNCHKKILKALENPVSFSIDSKYLNKDGNIRDALISFTPLQPVEDRIEYVFLIFKDITDKKIQIEERASLNAFRVTIDSVNDILFNYMNYLKLLHDDLLTINGELNSAILQEKMNEFDIEFRKTFDALIKLSDLSSFKTKRLSDDFEILEI